MKITKLFRTSAIILAGLALAVSSCREPEPSVKIVPVFPELVQDNNVAPGSTLTLSFDANADWEVSVPSENLQWFWINDNSFKVDKVSGKVTAGEKSSVAVQIGVSETEEFDMNRSCDVTLTMGGESKVIAKYMRPAKARALAVYAAKVENGAFVTNDDGTYVYESAELSSASLLWSEADTDFRLPVRVEANCEWTMELPEWLDGNVPESTVGVVEVVLTGASLDAASGKIVFKDGSEALKEFEVSVPSCREFAVYAVQLDDNGEFMFADEGGYLYTEESVQAVTLAWPGSDFRLPVKVDSKCDWTVETPEWLTVSASGETAGVIEFNLQGVPSKYPLEETAGTLAFRFAGETVYSIEVTIPGCKYLSSHTIDMGLTAFDFSFNGNLKNSTGYSMTSATGQIFGHSEVQVFAVEMADGRFTTDSPSWLDIEVSAYDTSKDADVLQTRTFTITAKKNDNAGERKAYVFFNRGYDWPSADKLFNDAGDAVSEDYLAYAVEVTQYGTDMPYITMAYSDEELALAGASFEAVTGTKKTSMQNLFGDAEYVYSLVYNNIYARDKAQMFFSFPYASYKVYDSWPDDMTGVAGFWLDFSELSETLTYGVVGMYSDEDLTPPSSAVTGYVVFYDSSDRPISIVETVFDPKKVIGEEAEIGFIGDSAQYAEMVGATLEEVTDGPLYDQYKEYAAPIYHLTYRMMGMPMRISIPASAVLYSPNPYMKRHIFRVNDLNYDENVGHFDLIDGGVDIYMSLDEGSTSTYERGNILFYNSDNQVVLALVCTLDLTE